MKNTILEIFKEIDDPRVKNRCWHNLEDILFIALCTLLSNGEDFADMELFGREREEWLRTILELPNGIPTHDTYNRVFQAIDPEQFKQCLGNHGALFIETFRDKLICLDGKKVKGASPKSRKNKGLYILNAWVSENKISICQEKVKDKSNEITAIPIILDELNIEGSTISIDAMGCQKNISDKIIDKKADYILAVKGNQKTLYKEVIQAFEDYPNSTRSKQSNKGHGREEKRSCSTLSSNKLSSSTKSKWKNISKLIKIESTRTIKGVTATETRYYISSKNETAKIFNKLIREHWSIENNLHWHLDVTFREDLCRARSGYAAENLSAMRKIALSRLTLFEDKRSLKKKRFKASLNLEYLLEMLLF